MTDDIDPIDDSKVATLKRLVNDPFIQFPWSAHVIDNGPIIQEGSGSILFRGVAEAKEEAVLAVEAVNSLPHLLARIEASKSLEADMTAMMVKHKKREQDLLEANNRYQQRYRAAENVHARGGIYVASKVRHAQRWLERRAAGTPIISTWIDEAGQGESVSLSDLWDRCMLESSQCRAMVLYLETGEDLKGAWVELGAALSHDVPVFAVGIDGFTISNHIGIQNCVTIDIAFDKAMALL